MIAQNNSDYIGQQLGNYELETLLKHRTTTDLYLAHDVKLDHPVFVEVLRTPVSDNPDLADQFQKRMETVSKIKEDNIAPVIETGISDDGIAYAVIEYIQGVWMSDLLADWRKDGTIQPVGDSLALGRSIAEALSAGHSAGLIFNDLRPENIIISKEDGHPVITNLGVPITSNARNGVLSESRTTMLDYTSPEELEGKAITRRSNIYSLGIILYELLTGHRPELPTSSWDIFEHSTMPKEVPLEEAREGLSGETYRLVRNCLWRQEWSRFETADEVISAIETATLAEQIEPNKPAIWPENKNRRAYLIVPILALLVIIAGVLLVRTFANGNSSSGDTTIPAVGDTTKESETSLVENNGEETGIVQTPAESGPTAIPTATLTREAPPTSALDTTIPLFNPLSDQVFNQKDTISFAWIWLSDPEEDELFTVYIEPEDTLGEPVAIGTVTEPESASLYRLDAKAANLGITSGSYLWQVRLENVSDGSMLVESDARRFIIAVEPTATPSPTNTPARATATTTITSTPAETSTSQPTATTVVACVPERPFGWIEYHVQAGDYITQFALAANVTVERVLAANCLTRNSVLSIGQLLYIPAPPATPTYTPSPTATPGPVVPPSTGGGGGGNNNRPEPTTPVEPTPRPSKTPVPVG
ncbi:MAG: protein kinase domain-containing protein [Candidatus Promineifilaceae bacterium]|jgi:serine/threonine protein kinase/LysM repeat protein